MLCKILFYTELGYFTKNKAIKCVSIQIKYAQIKFPLFSFWTVQVASLSQSSCVSSVELTDRRGGAWAWSQIIRTRESLALNKSLNRKMCIIPNFVIPHDRFFPNGLSFIIPTAQISQRDSPDQQTVEPVFVNVYGAQESIPRNQFRQAGNRFLGSLKVLHGLMVHKHLDLGLPSSLSPLLYISVHVQTSMFVKVI